ncbi:MAG TPA: hypothetical protein VG755_17690 [Nannocystaceae bacterium]|nr:hypothetical protein [Nannocystaceae bacterium]
MFRLATTFLLGLVLACSTIRTSVPAQARASTVRIDEGETEDCQRPTQRFPRAALALDGELDDPALATELAEVPGEIRRTARAVGLEPQLARLLKAQREGGDARSVETVALRLQVVMRISAVEIDVDSLLFEADCTGNQLDEALRELHERAARRVLGFTIASIAVGAAAGIATGVIDAKGGTPAEAVGGLGISGGIATAGLGVGALVPERGRVVYPHERNLFVPIVTGEDPHALFPAYVFRMLRAPVGEGGRAPREELLEDWDRIIDEAIPERERAVARAVLFGKGGVYDTKLIEVRERMYDALESQLNAFDRDLEQLYAYFGKVLQE